MWLPSPHNSSLPTSTRVHTFGLKSLPSSMDPLREGAHPPSLPTPSRTQSEGRDPGFVNL